MWGFSGRESRRDVIEVSAERLELEEVVVVV
jgi:hypothetical protein